MKEEEFQDCVRRYRSLALRVGWEFLYRPEDVEEVVQEALLACWRKRRSLRSAEDFRRLLLGATVNQCRKRRRAYARTPPPPRPPGQAGADPGAAAERAEELSALRRALERLDEDERAVVILCLVEGLSYQEAARLLGLSLAALRNRLHRARRLLRRLLEDLLG